MSHTNIICIIDRSGSMHGEWEQTKESFKDFIKGHKAAAGTASITLVFFDHEYNKVLENSALDTFNVDQIFKDFQPRGSTALNDAIGRTLVGHIEKDYKADGTIVVIVSDGGENASSLYSTEQVNKLKKTQEDSGWEFVMMGESQAQMETYNIKYTNRTVFDKSSLDTVYGAYTAAASVTYSIRDKFNQEATETV